MILLMCLSIYLLWGFGRGRENFYDAKHVERSVCGYWFFNAARKAFTNC